MPLILVPVKPEPFTALLQLAPSAQVGEWAGVEALIDPFYREIREGTQVALTLLDDAGRALSSSIATFPDGKTTHLMNNDTLETRVNCHQEATIRIHLKATYNGQHTIHQSSLSILTPSPYVYVPPGPFLSGPNNDVVDVGHGYWIGKYEVTNKEYRTFLTTTGKEAPDPTSLTNGLWDDAADDHPVYGLLKPEMSEYCQWLTATTGKTHRLPTKLEWEKAARGTDGRKYPWGDRVDNEVLNWTNWEYDAQDIEGTSPVGSYPHDQSPFGCFDMLGNISERVEDPTNSMTMGGGWNRGPPPLYQEGYLPDNRGPPTGFRVVREE